MRHWLALPVLVASAGTAPTALALDTTVSLLYQGHLTADPPAGRGMDQHGVLARLEASQEAGGVLLQGTVRASVDPERDRDEYDDTLYLEELTAQRAFGSVDVIAGRQFVRGGRATLVNPTDAFDARDYRDALLSADRVRAIDGLRATWFSNSWNLNVVATPVHTKSLMPHPDSRWFFALPPAADVGGGQLVPLTYAWADYDATHGGTAQTLVKFNHEGEGVSYAMSWFDGEDNLPAFDGRDPVPGPAGLAIAIDQLYADKRALGVDAEVLLGKAVLRVEAARIDLTYANGRTDDYDHVVAGFDLNLERGLFGKETYFAFEYSKQFARNGQDWTKEDLRHIFSNAFLARVDVTLGGHDSLVTDLVYDHLNGQNALLVDYRHDFTDQLVMHVTIDLLGGSSDTFFGQFTRNDRLGLSLEYTF